MATDSEFGHLFHVAPNTALRDTSRLRGTIDEITYIEFSGRQRLDVRACLAAIEKLASVKDWRTDDGKTSPAFWY